MSAIASSPGYSDELSGSSPPSASSAPKRKKRQNFSGLTAQQKVQAKKANNRQAAQNLRDRKKQQENELEDHVKRIEANNERLAAQLARLEQENKAIQEEARAFADQHIQRFQLQDLAQRLMGAVQTDSGNGQSIAALLGAMGKAIDTTAAVPDTAASPTSIDCAASPADLSLGGWSPAAVSIAGAAEEMPVVHLQGDVEGEEAGENEMVEVASPPPGPMDLSGLPELPADLFLDLLPHSPAIVPDSDHHHLLLPVLPNHTNNSGSSNMNPFGTTFSSSSPFSLSPSPVPALPVLSPESVRSALSPSSALPMVPGTKHSAAAGAWPAVPPLPSGLQQLLMLLICTSLMRLPQAPLSSAAAAGPTPGPAPSMMSLPLSKRQPGSSAAELSARCCSATRSCKEYGPSVCSSTAVQPCVC